MTVYVVIEVGEGEVWGVFSQRDDAKKFLKNCRKRHELATFDIETSMVDAYVD